MSTITGLTCRECGQEYPVAPLHVCETCFGPLEVVYDYESIRQQLTRKVIESRPASLWRYRELLPVTGEPTVGLHSGFTPLVKADRLAAYLGVKELYVKDDSGQSSTFSYKDRVVSVAISKAIEFGFDTVSLRFHWESSQFGFCARGAPDSGALFLFLPTLSKGNHRLDDLWPRAVGIRGNYDDVNRLCSEIADKYGWAFVNINLRPYYTEGAKTYGFEIAEQLGWRLPQHVIVPTAGGTILPKVAKAFEELKKIGLVDGSLRPKIIYCPSCRLRTGRTGLT
jgi:threonine synthase